MRCITINTYVSFCCKIQQRWTKPLKLCRNLLQPTDDCQLEPVLLQSDPRQRAVPVPSPQYQPAVPVVPGRQPAVVPGGVSPRWGRGHARGWRILRGKMRWIGWRRWWGWRDLWTVGDAWLVRVIDQVSVAFYKKRTNFCRKSFSQATIV